MADPTVKGTFTEAAQSATLDDAYIRILLDFASTGSANLEVQGHDGNWVVDETYTGDTAKMYYNLARDKVRLNCTDATGNIVYSMVPVQGRLGIGG